MTLENARLWGLLWVLRLKILRKTGRFWAIARAVFRCNCELRRLRCV